MPTSNGQGLKNDPYVSICFKFSEDLNSDFELSKLKNYFANDLRTDSLLTILSSCRLELEKNRDRISYYITRFERTNLFFYNISLDDPETKESFGQIRIMFKDNKDYLIDDWIYFREDNSEND